MRRPLAAITFIVAACGSAGSDEAMTPDGVVRFGTTNPRTDCNHTPYATHFPAGAEIYWWAGFNEALPSGAEVVERDYLDGDLFNTDTYTVPAGGADCLTRTHPTGGLIEGTWRVVLQYGSKTEAEGTFAVP